MSKEIKERDLLLIAEDVRDRRELRVDWDKVSELDLRGTFLWMPSFFGICASDIV